MSGLKRQTKKPLDFDNQAVFNWSECNYRISENADISMVCWQSARGIYSKRLKFRGIPLKSEFERSFPQV